MPPPHHDHHHEHGHHHDHDHHHPKPHEWHRIQEETDYWWEELPPHKQKAAETLGYTATLWDEDQDAATEDKEWSQLTPEQQMAAAVFGYSEATWNAEDEHGPRDKHHAKEHHGPPHHHDHHRDHDHHHHHHHAHDEKEEEEEKKDKEDDEDDKETEETTQEPDIDLSNLNVTDFNNNNPDETDNHKNQNNNSNNKPLFKVSKAYGGQGGGAFDHGNNRHIDKLTVYADGHVVYGLEVAYSNQTLTVGTITSGKAHAMTLASDECIVSVTVRSNALVQCLTFQTNKGQVLGPCGGKGWPKIIRKDTEGKEDHVKAPLKFQLCGFLGRSGAMLDQIAFCWGVVPK